MSSDTNKLSVHASGVEITGLRKAYGSNEVLKGIDLNVAPGEVVCLIGPSGSGKSTLLRCVNLLEQPNGGTNMVGGFNATDPDVNLDKMRQQVGMVGDHVDAIAGYGDAAVNIAACVAYEAFGKRLLEVPEFTSAACVERVALVAGSDIHDAVDDNRRSLQPRCSGKVE